MTHVVVTGASSGLGSALARRYASQGAALSLLGRDITRLEEVAETCRPAAARVHTHRCDVRDGEAMERLLHEVDAALPIDVVIANAGIGGRQALAPACGESGALAREILEVNMTGVIHTIAPLLGRFTQRRRGHVAVVSSVAGLHGLAEAPAYSASKAAVIAYGEGLRRLLAACSVQVTVIVPGFIATPMSASLPFRGPLMWSPERAADRIVRGIERNEPTIVFPWQLHIAAAALRLLPSRLRDRALALASRTVRLRA